MGSWKPYQIKSWRKRFPERAEALKDVNPIDTVISFKDNMTLHLGGKTIELLYVEDPYNPGDIAVWLPQSGRDARRVCRLHRPPSRHAARLQPRHDAGACSSSWRCSAR